MSRLPECLALMRESELDVLLLGREANARTVADTSRLWLAGTRAFAPGCVVVRTTGAVHVLSNSDDAVPDGFPASRLYGVTWNPEKLLGALLAIDGVAGARRIGTDGMTPMMYSLLQRALPAADVVDAAPVFARLWQVPEPRLDAGVTAAAEVAVAGLGAMVDALRPGVRPRTLRGACAAAFASFGVTTPAFEAVAAPLDVSSSTWIAPERLLADGERVVLRAGALREGWEASLARTFVVGDSPVALAPPVAWTSLLASCIAGTTVGALRGRDAVVYGVGRGVEPWDDDVVLVPGMMCAVEFGDDDGLHQDVLRITEREPGVVTRFA